MFGFIITTHFNNYNLIKKCVDLLFNAIAIIPQESYILLYVNETTCEKVFNIKNEYLNNNFEVIFIKDQKAGNGLTGTWNKGINRLINLKNNNIFDCKVITILGHDTFVNESISHILNTSLVAEEKKELVYFGPLYKSGKTNTFLPWQDEKEYKKYVNSKNELYNKYIIGSFLTIPLNTLMNNIFYTSLFDNINKYYFFDEEKYPFGYNEVEFYKRLKKNFGKAKLIPNCIINHISLQSWISLEK